MNSAVIYYEDIVKKSISYEFKSEFLTCDNNSLLNKDLLSKNSGLAKGNLDNSINSLVEQCINKYGELFYNTMMNEYIEDGYISDSQRIYGLLQNEYGIIVASFFLSKIYVKYVYKDKVIKSLLYIMSKLNPEDLNGNNEAIIAFALSHKDYEVRDLALQCFEKWNDTKYLELLKSLNVEVDFLQEYLDYIIKFLETKREEEDVH